MSRHPHISELSPWQYLQRPDAIIRRVATVMLLLMIGAFNMPLFCLIPIYLAVEWCRDRRKVLRFERYVYGGPVATARRRRR